MEFHLYSGQQVQRVLCQLVLFQTRSSETVPKCTIEAEVTAEHEANVTAAARQRAWCQEFLFFFTSCLAACLPSIFVSFIVVGWTARSTCSGHLPDRRCLQDTPFQLINYKVTTVGAKQNHYARPMRKNAQHCWDTI